MSRQPRRLEANDIVDRRSVAGPLQNGLISSSFRCGLIFVGPGLSGEIEETSAIAFCPLHL